MRWKCFIFYNNEKYIVWRYVFVWVGCFILYFCYFYFKWRFGVWFFNLMNSYIFRIVRCWWFSLIYYSFFVVFVCIWVYSIWIVSNFWWFWICDIYMKNYVIYKCLFIIENIDFKYLIFDLYLLFKSSVFVYVYLGFKICYCSLK